MKTDIKTIEINGVQYVRADSMPASQAISTDDLPCVIVRSGQAGVFCGYVKERDRATKVVVLDRAIRLWRWTGFTLSQVARDGVAGDGDNRFGVVTNGHEVADVCEIIPCSAKARAAIEAVEPRVVG